jgi:hypothetical protein
LLFEAKDFNAISESIRRNPEIIDEKFSDNLKKKFTKLIKPVCLEGQKIACAESVEPWLLL